MPSVNKKKIFNDPIYGFITLPYEIIFDLIEHPYFQRLRRIKQLGLTHLVYPGALHTRFHHAMGTMNLMTKAIDVIRSKGHEITDEEAVGVTIAILLHDIGHGPFSHALEHSIVNGISHEEISTLFMDKLNQEFKGKLDVALKIFRNEYPKKFLHQLVSGQLDMDRLDYLRRDSFFTGVSEGVISTERIITMLTVHNDHLAIEEKGIYSIEKFIIARRLMYWQVYLHKTVLSAENLLVNILKRAKSLANNNEELFCTPSLKTFLYAQHDLASFKNNPKLLDEFANLDDYDIMTSVKVWQKSEDKILAKLCKMMVNRNLYKVVINDSRLAKDELNAIKEKFSRQLKISEKEIEYFVFQDAIENNAYNPKMDKINILLKNNTVKDISEAADTLNISSLARPVKKWFVCYPKK
ncbi:MAG: HD domain-containing protein [Flavobacteriales bacterium]|nr:HD domain-containing protein [Flavobacteriales bacterium]MCW8913597.1 HD domain-containing protein [Flavobacteriales bacterium]MCW8938666.1 HD domain-containing protein [Flavobacteriales bacterium]MCW8940189.1 HD domain-containing protein [Flavobacteriales bacterium]MCW8967847.1 HD domain-containing protein [Flavobacteriales bacterium]